MTLCEAPACLATVGERIRAKPSNKSAMYRCTVSAKDDNTVTVQFIDPDVLYPSLLPGPYPEVEAAHKRQAAARASEHIQVFWNWERVQVLRKLTSAEQAAFSIFNQIVGVLKGVEAQCLGTDRVVQLPAYAKVKVNELLNELASAGIKFTDADMERARELALGQATEEARRLVQEQKLAKQKRISEVERQLATVYKTVELQRFGQEGLGEVQRDAQAEVNRLLRALANEGILQDQATSRASELHRAAKIDVQSEAREAWERANSEAVQMRLRASGQSNVKNELNKAAFFACMQGNVQALRDAAGGCFATFELKEEVEEFFDGAGWFESDPFPVGYDYGSHFIEFGPDLPADHTRMQPGTTLLQAAKVLGWSKPISEALENIGVPPTYKHNQREIVRSYVVTAQASPEKDGLVHLIDLSGEVLDVSVNTCTAAALGEKVRSLKSILCNVDVQILLPDGRLLAPQEQVSRAVREYSKVPTKRARSEEVSSDKIQGAKDKMHKS